MKKRKRKVILNILIFLMSENDFVITDIRFLKLQGFSDIKNSNFIKEL